MQEQRLMSQPYKRAGKLDEFLATHGFYRKRMPEDEYSLFQCIADQILGTTRFSKMVRQRFVTYFWENETKMIQVINNMNLVSNAGQTVVNYVISQFVSAIYNIYKKRVFVFKEDNCECLWYPAKPGERCENVITTDPRECRKMLIVCVDRQFHWDSVYSAEHLRILAAAQGLVYRTIFEDVVGFQNIDEALDIMLKTPFAEMPKQTHIKNLLEEEGFFHRNEKNASALVLNGIIPFSFSTAKSLDFSIYRNIVLDIEKRHRCSAGISRPWGLGVDPCLTVGAKCVVYIRHSITCVGHIQKLLPERNSALVFLEEIGRLEEIDQSRIQLCNRDRSNEAARRYVRKWKYIKSTREQSTEETTETPQQSTPQTDEESHVDSIQDDEVATTEDDASTIEDEVATIEEEVSIDGEVNTVESQATYYVPIPIPRANEDTNDEYAYQNLPAVASQPFANQEGTVSAPMGYPQPMQFYSTCPTPNPANAGLRMVHYHHNPYPTPNQESNSSVQPAWSTGHNAYKYYTMAQMPPQHGYYQNCVPIASNVSPPVVYLVPSYAGSNLARFHSQLGQPQAFTPGYLSVPFYRAVPMQHPPPLQTRPGGAVRNP